MPKIQVEIELPDGWMLSKDYPHMCCYEHRQDTTKYDVLPTSIDPSIILGVHPPFIVVPVMWDDDKAAKSRAKLSTSITS